MTLFVYKFIRQAKPLFIVLMETLDYRNRFLDYNFPVVNRRNRSHCMALQCNSLLGGEKYTKCWLLIQGLTVVKQVA